MKRIRRIFAHEDKDWLSFFYPRKSAKSASSAFYSVRVQIFFSQSKC